MNDKNSFLRQSESTSNNDIVVRTPYLGIQDANSELDDKNNEIKILKDIKELLQNINSFRPQ